MATIDSLDAFTAETVVQMLVKAAGNEKKSLTNAFNLFFHPATKDELEDFKSLSLSLVTYLRAY